VFIKTTPDTVTKAARFFLEPGPLRQRQYEALRAYFAEGAPSAEVARRFGYQPGAFRVLCWRFRHQMDRDFFRESPRGPKSQPRKDAVRARVIALRKCNFSVYDIRDELDRAGPGRLSVTAIQEVLRAAGFARLPRRADEERPQRPRPLADAIADVRGFSLAPRIFSTRVGGLFLLLPLLARLDLDTVVAGCKFPGTKMIPAAHAVRAALVLKLLGKARRSHVMDLLFDDGVALAVGLNALPKTTFMAQYSSRLGRQAIVRLLGAWVAQLRAERLIDAASFNLDFHSISYFGDDPVVEKHYVPRRSQRRKAVLAFLAQDATGQVFCYANADLRKGEETDEVLRFVTFWEHRYGERPHHLVFDSKLTTYRNLSQLNALGITFITLRRRSPKLLAACATLPRSAWRTVELDVPHRKFKTPRVVDQRVHLPDYKGTLRQLLIRDLGHDEPTILLTNDLTSSLKAIITRYAQRMLIENGLADSVAFFHLDALSSAVALNVDFDVLLTVIASGVYRLFAKPLRGYERAQARQLFRRFLDTTARVTITEEVITVRLPRRAHNPILLDAGLIGTPSAIPWWGGRLLRLEIV
jgi:transposase-like protein